MLSREEKTTEKINEATASVDEVLNGDSNFLLDIELKEKTEKLLGVKGYCTNIPENDISNEKIIAYYHDLWRIEQAFRISKTDLKTRPIFHNEHDAIKAHVLLCFMALMMSKLLEIKTGLSVQCIRDILWNIYEAHIGYVYWKTGYATDEPGGI